MRLIDQPSALRDEAWHALAATQVEQRLHTDAQGLSASEVEARLFRFGPNQLEEKPPPSALVVLLRQFRSPLVYILVAAAVVTLLLEEYIDAAVIGVVLALNAIIGFTQERRAEGGARPVAARRPPRATAQRPGMGDRQSRTRTW